MDRALVLWPVHINIDSLTLHAASVSGLFTVLHVGRRVESCLFIHTCDVRLRRVYYTSAGRAITGKEA